ncbi:MAG: hypothetical protein CBC49_011050 [Alphaproteobacteria bacterium TMED89]|nr:MAG: hypothetical protein CBC49_011050 [Alphaproteobacteria bacterium TMED89]
MLRHLKLAGLSALLLASTAGAQMPVPLVYNKAGYAPVSAPNVVAYSVNGQKHYMPAAAPVAPGRFTKTARHPVYAPSPPIVHYRAAPPVIQQPQVHYRRQEVVTAPAPTYPQQAVATQRPVVYEAAVLPVVKNSEGYNGEPGQQQYIPSQGQGQGQGQSMFQPETGYYTD